LLNARPPSSSARELSPVKTREISARVRRVGHRRDLRAQRVEQSQRRHLGFDQDLRPFLHAQRVRHKHRIAGTILLLASETILIARLDTENLEGHANWGSAFRVAASRWGLTASMIVFPWTLQDRIAEIGAVASVASGIALTFVSGRGSASYRPATLDHQQAFKPASRKFGDAEEFQTAPRSRIDLVSAIMSDAAARAETVLWLRHRGSIRGLGYC
jgi:hypothetical protein